MYSFVISTKPKSYNSKDKRKAADYQQRLQVAFRESYPTHALLTEELYGLVYHFYRINTGIDADNISKSVWDSLKTVTYLDDKQVKMRVAGSFDLNTNDLTVLDFSGLPGVVIDQLLDSTKTEMHVLYIECGRFTTDLIQLNLERDGY